MIELNRRDFALGIPLELAVFYALSYTSALWVGGDSRDDYLWALLLSAAISVILGIIVSRQPGAAVAASSAMFLIFLIGLFLGSEGDKSAPPLALDVPALFLHGARTTLVVNSMVLIGTAGVVRLMVEARKRDRPWPRSEELGIGVECGQNIESSPQDPGVRQSRSCGRRCNRLHRRSDAQGIPKSESWWSSSS
jgi:hypothetical protein